MNKPILILLFTIAIVVSCYSIPKFILDNQVTLTPEQKSAYERKVSERPDSTYNPLQVGNKWWRRLNDDSFQVLREVIDSTIINDKVYYQVTGLFGSGINRWIRNEGDLTLAYDEYDLDNNPNTTEIIHEDFTSFGYYDVYHDLYHYPVIWNCFCDGEYYLTAYGGIPTYLRFHDYTVPNDPFIFITFGWARGFGITYVETSDYDISFIACRIGGVYYGVPVSITDNELPPVPQIELSCYPNPFNPSTTIVYSLPKDTQVNLIVYNLKGQKVKTLQNGRQKAGQHSIVWNGTDDQNRKVTSAIYFYKLITPDKVLTNKMILMM